MIMFFRKKKKHEEVKREDITLELSGLISWLEDEYKTEHQIALSTVKTMHSDILTSFSDVRTALKRLEDASFEQRDKITTAANMIKDTFVNKTNNILNNESEIRELDRANLKNFYLNSIKNIRELTTISPKQTVLLTSYFKEQTSDLIENVRKTEKKLNDMNKFLDSKGKIIWIMQKTKEDSEQQKQDITKYLGFQQQIEDKKREIEELQNEIKSDQERLTKLTSDKRWNDLEKAEKDVYYTERKLAETKDSLEQMFALVSKPLKKLEYAASHGYSPGIGTRFIGDFLNSPLRTISEDDGINKFKTVLHLLRDAHKDKQVPLKAKEEEKILDLIRRCGSDLPLMAERYKKLNTELEKKRTLHKSMHPELIKEKQEIEDKINKDKKETTLLHKDIDYIETDMKHMLTEINSRKDKLEKLVSDYANRKINITQSI